MCGEGGGERSTNGRGTRTRREARGGGLAGTARERGGRALRLRVWKGYSRDLWEEKSGTGRGGITETR